MQKNRKWIVGNWKMHGTQAMAKELASAIAAGSENMPQGVEMVLCPPAVFLSVVKESIQGSAIKLGGQDCAAQASGAYTGGISAAMLKDVGCAYVIIGHSERRQHQQETSQEISQKAAQALENGLVPIICVGETATERDAGSAQKVVEEQVKTSISKVKGDFLLAYEPVWAIGSGRTPSPQDIEAMHGHIGKVAGGVPVLYGGSVKAANSKQILATGGVAGVLVGGASLDVKEFCGIVAAI